MVRMRASDRIDDIQILRGVAALVVVLHHFAVITRPFSTVHSLLRYHYLADLGACGVDIFFCISGFVMMTAIMTLRRDGRFSAVDFLARRVIRIVPLYWIITTIFAVLVLVCGLWQDPFANGLPVPLTPHYLLSSYTLLPSYMPGTHTIAPFLIQGWTLSYEFYFYVLICGCAIFCERPLHIALALVTAIGAVWVTARALPASGLALQAFAANSIVFEFAFGVGIFLLSRSAWRAPRLYTWLGVLGLLATVFFPAMQAKRVLLWGLPSALIVFGAVCGTRRTRVQRFALLLGDASYSIYLVHLIPLDLYTRLLRSGYFAGNASQYCAILVGCVVTALIGVGVYRWLEKPLTRGLNRWYGLHLGRVASRARSQ
jgi:exopolysaccharide production protein ExoZ